MRPYSRLKLYHNLDICWLPGGRTHLFYFFTMDSVQFQKLSLSNKSHFLWEKGIHLCSRQDPLFLVHLYAFRNFYVEVRFSHQLCRVEHIGVLESTEDLQVFLNDLPMPGFLS